MASPSACTWSGARSIPEWAGTASAYSDTESVAKDLVEGLSFAETVVSQANSVIVIVDQHGRVQRFNKLSEEYTGKRERTHRAACSTCS